LWTETETSYTTNDPNEINEFLDQQKSRENNKNNEIKKPDPLNELKEKFLNFFGWDLNPENPNDRKKLDEGSKNRVKAAEQINEANKFLIINGTMFFVGEGAAYCIEEFGGAILVRIIGKEALQFTVNSSKFDYFFGRVLTGEAHNIARSVQNVSDLSKMGITTESQLTEVFAQALNDGRILATKTNSYGTTVTRCVNVGNNGSISVGFFYPGSNMSSIPTVTTIIPKTW